ncbi:phage tail spike protein [Bacillus wiedmannii]|uniref:phage tail spike protein n=1 Tax=Bacillus wiedmannii TaxID=1890302 RepID=UPI003CFA3C2B
MENKSVFYILNEKQRVIGIGSNNSPNSLPYFEDNLIESIETGVVTYEFSVPANHTEAGKLIANNHVVVRDLDGNFLLFTIKEVMETHEDGKLVKKVFCENTAVTEMLGQVVEPQTIPSATLANAIKTLFKGVKEWSAIDIPYTEGRDIVISEHTNLLEVLNDLTNLYGLEMYFTVELANVVIKKKIVNFRKKRGQETDLRFEYGLNLAGVTRKEDSTGVITALYGIGKSDNDNTISLKNYKHVDDGDIVHLAQTDVVSSREAVNRWGRNGQHIYGIYKSEKADTVEQLYKETLAELKRRVNPVLTYEASVVTLERITGYDGQKLRIGDRVLVIDKTFNPAILLSARVVELQRSFTNPTNDAVKLGEYRPLKPTLSKLLKDVQTSTNQAVKYPDLPKIQQEYTESVINPIKTVVDDIEEEVEETVQAVVNIKASVEGMQADYSEIKEVIQDIKIYKQDTPPTDVPVNTLWINTSEKPNFQYRWDGTSWIPMSPATAEDIGAIGTDFFNEKMEAINADTAKINAAIKATDGKVATMQTDLASKVNAEWVNGQLVSKANKGDSYTKTESDNALNGKVSTTTYTTDKNGIITRLDSAETRVTQTENSVKLAATKDELTQSADGINSKINKINSDLTVQAGLIESKVSNSTYTTDKTANETRFKNAESRITQTEANVKLKVNSEDVYKKTEVDPKLNAKVDTTVYNNKIASIEATNKSITQRVEEVNSTVTNLSVGGGNIIDGTEFTNVNGWTRWSNYGAVSTITENALKQLPTPNSLRVETTVDGKQQVVPNGTPVGVQGGGRKFKVRKGQEYTVSMNVATSELGWLLDYVYIMYTTEGGNQRIPTINTLEFPIVANINDRQNNNYYRVCFTFKPTRDDDQAYLLIAGNTKRALDGTNGYAWIRVNALKVEEGNKPTSWEKSQADIEAQIGLKVNSEEYSKKVSEIKQTTDSISQTVSDVNKTVTAQGTRLSTAESAITQANTQIGLKVNSTDVYKKAEVDGKVNAKVDTTTYNNKMAELKITTDKITQSVSSVTTKVDGMDVGGKNLILKSKQAFSKTDYLINMYTLSEDWVAGEEYTFVIKGTVPAGQKFGVWMNGGSDGSWWATNVYSKGVTYVTFKAYAPKDGHARTLSLYNAPQNTTLATVEWVALYRGNMPMDWSPAPEDVDSVINSKVDTSTYTSKMSSIDTSISGITQRVTATESSTSSLGGRMSTAEASIKTQAGQISSKVESTTYNTDMNGLKGRVSTAETWINQTKTDITLLAKKNEVGSLLNQSPDGFKILGKYLDISGLVTFSVFDTATQNKINAIDTKAGDGVTKATAAQTTANTANSTANTAKTNAATAQTAATNAQTTANTANSTANGVKTKTDAWTINSTQINGASIATGTVTANQLNVNNIFANAAVISAISTYSINADKIKSGKISGVTYESINASNPKVKAVIEGNTFKSYGIPDSVTKAQSYAELKEGKVTIYEIAETGSPFGNKKAFVEPARLNVQQGSYSTALEPSELRFWVPNMTGKISYDVTPKNNSGYGLRLEAPGGVHIKSNNNSKSALSFEAQGAMWFDGWGNLWGDEYGAQNSTWSVKDGGGRVKFLIPVGKNAGGATEIHSHGSGLDYLHNGYRFMSFWGDATNRVIRFGDGGQFKYQKAQGRFEFRSFDDGGWANAAAGTFTSASSFKWKTDINNYYGNATDIITNSDIMTYKMKPSEKSETNEIIDISTLPTHIGLIAEYAPKEVQSEDGAGIDLYAMISVAWKAIQELNVQINEIKAENTLLKAQLVGTNN